MYAVISYPRSGSRSLAKKYNEITGLPIGYLHHAKSVPSYCLTYQELTENDWILHAHWHTVHLLKQEYKKHIEENYKIVHIDRDEEHIFLSSIITMATGNIDFCKEDIPSNIDINLVDEYFKRMKPTKENMLDWRIDIRYDFDKLYNKTSLANFENNKERVKNYKQLNEKYIMCQVG